MGECIITRRGGASAVNITKLPAMAFGNTILTSDGWIEFSDSEFKSSPVLTDSWHYSGEAWEIVTKIKVTHALSSTYTIFAGRRHYPYDYYAPGLQIKNSKLIAYYSTNGSSAAIILTGNTTISLDTEYYVKLSWNGTNLALYISTDGTNWTSDGSAEISTPCITTETNLVLGAWETYQQNFTCGRINIFDTYVKIGNNIVWSGS